MRRSVWRLAHNKDGAVAPTVALSLVALIAAGGIAFDYARLASLDTELQGAADQAALAAASQLDGQTGACARAAAAANDLLANQTLMANDATATRAIVVANESTCDATGSVRFYKSYNQVNDTFGDPATLDAEARVVVVQVNPRQAVYALTPVVGAFRSGNVNAQAIASLGSAICKVPPVMMCNPAEPASNADPNYDFNAVEGQGLRLVIGDPDAPGNFGFLRTDAAGATQVAKELGYNVPPAGCISTNGVETEPGNMIAVRAAFNTRFDITENGSMTCPAGGTCSPSQNSRKDLVREVADQCNLGNNGWRESANPYRATSPTNPLPVDGTADPTAMGYPRDMCHAVSVLGSCTGGIIGNGVWDIDAYFRVNFGWNRTQWMANAVNADGTYLAATAADVASVSRYDVYKWEMNNPSLVPSPRQVGTTAMRNYARPVCRTPGITPGGAIPDRRRISVAVVNCRAQDLRGHSTNVQVRKWVDVFLVEPAVARGNGPTARSRDGDIYAEVIGVTSSGGSADNTVTRRDVPYLIR